MWSHKITCFFSLNYKLSRLCSLPRCLRIGEETTHYCSTTQTQEHVYLVPFLPYNLILLISPFHPVHKKPLPIFFFSLLTCHLLIHSVYCFCPTRLSASQGLALCRWLMDIATRAALTVVPLVWASCLADSYGHVF